MADVAQDAEIQLPDVCERAWTADQEEEEGADRDFDLYKPVGRFKNDFLAYCKILGIRPHPQLLGILPPIEPPKEDLPSNRMLSRHATRFAKTGGPEGEAGSEVESERAQHFDLTVVDSLTIRGMLFGRADSLATLAALKTCSALRSLTFSRAGLSVEQVYDLALALPHTHVQELVLEYNPTEADESDGRKKERVLIPKGTGPLPHPLYAGAEFAPVLSTAPPSPAAPLPDAAAASGEAHPPARGSAPPTPTRGRSTSPHSPRRRPTVIAPRRASLGLSSSTYTLAGKTRGRAFGLLARKFQRLTRLSLRGNDLGAVEAGCIADSLVHNTLLQSLILSHNPLGTAGVSALFTALREHRGALAMLGLANTGFSFSCVPVVVDAFAGCGTDVGGMRARGETEDRLVRELVMDINGLGHRERMLAEATAQLDAAAAARESAAAAAAPAPVVDPKAKGKAAASAPAPAAAPAARRAVPEHAHPDYDLFEALRLPPVVETTVKPPAPARVEEVSPPAPATPAAPVKGGKASAAAPAPASPAAPAQPSPPASPMQREEAAEVARTFLISGNRSLVQVDASCNPRLGADGIEGLALGLARAMAQASAPQQVEAPRSRRASLTGGAAVGAAPSVGVATSGALLPPRLRQLVASACVPDLFVAPLPSPSRPVSAHEMVVDPLSALPRVVDHEAGAAREANGAKVAAAQAALERVGVALLI